ncbi:ThuA domain-containing protein [Stieleria varia]|uniref:Trehalose utilization n=1 Tax=Stieleria varia TaxID=2528005 RepID=A0A5C6B1E5_9BACT|nr:ThuA domain-containing protein [Stieleria varia]TWU05700.1 Trehalose utilization [Stieleria varia]
MKTHLNRRVLGTALIAAFLTVSVAGVTNGQDKSAASAKPLKVLLVAGGCCHDYATQTQLLKKGIEARINAVVTVEFNPSKTTETRFEIYEKDNWADGYDVILHDECSANVTEQPYVGRILNAHRNGVPAVNLHCAMHSYRWGDFRSPVELGADNAGWYEMLGVQSTGHGPQAPIDIVYSDQSHPVTAGLENWTTIKEELYNNVRVFSQTQVLASGKQLTPPNKRQLKENPDAKPNEADAVVVWTNEFGPNKTKVFCTTLGHNNETVGDDRYLDLVTRGILWSTGNLTADGKPVAALVK